MGIARSSHAAAAQGQGGNRRHVRCAVRFPVSSSADAGTASTGVAASIKISFGTARSSHTAATQGHGTRRLVASLALVRQKTSDPCNGFFDFKGRVAHPPPQAPRTAVATNISVGWHILPMCHFGMRSRALLTAAAAPPAADMLPANTE